MKRFLTVCLALILILGIISFVQTKRSDKTAAPADTPDTAVQDSETEPVPEKEPETEPEPVQEPEPLPDPVDISLIAVGDNLIHNTVFKCAATGDGYDFTPFYEPVKELVQAADIAYVNQEAPLATDIAEPSGYPAFNTPQQAGLDLMATGFNVVNQANNHSMDRGVKGIMSTVNFWKQQQGVMMMGMYDSPEDRQTSHIFEQDGCKIGFLTYTYGTNGIPIPEGKEYILPLIDKEQMHADIERIKPLCDAIVVSMHWGIEYDMEPNSEQKELAQFLADEGVLLIIGMHPHVIQGVEWLEGAQGNKTFCVYSLGNFISAQNKRATMLGGMLTATIHRDPDGSMSVVDPGVIPLVTHYESGGSRFRVYPIWKYTDDLADRHAVNQNARISVKYFKETAEEIYGEYVVEDTKTAEEAAA